MTPSLVSLLIRALIFNPNHLLRGPISKYSLISAKASTYEFWKSTNVYSIFSFHFFPVALVKASSMMKRSDDDIFLLSPFEGIFIIHH
jgi:hypothetical protein